MTNPISKPRSGPIVHLCPYDDWQTAQVTGEYRAASLETEGIIHFSTPAQILDVANAFYRGLKDLVLLWVDPSLLHSPFRWEPPFHPTPENQPAMDFPHLYGPLNLDAVTASTTFLPDSDGVFRTLPTQVKT